MTELARLLADRGVTYRHVAEAGGPSPATLSRLLAGKRAWRAEWVEALSRLLGVPAGVVTAREALEPGDTPAAPVAAEGPDVLTTDEAAALLRCSPSFLYRRTDLIPPTWVGGRRRYLREDLIRHLRRRRGARPPEALGSPALRVVPARPSGTLGASGIRRKRARRW